MMIKIGITWAASCGKTSLVDYLRERWFMTFREASTWIIEEGKKSGKSVEDIVNKPDFQDTVHLMKRWQFLTDATNGCCIYDTTFIDDIAHRKFKNIPISDEMKNFISSHRYNAIFFLEHPWVVEDNGIRIESLDDVKKLDELKKESLPEFWYSFVPYDTESLQLDGTKAVLLPSFDALPNISDRISRRGDIIARLIELER
jgi:predicted ATPase